MSEIDDEVLARLNSDVDGHRRSSRRGTAAAETAKAVKVCLEWWRSRLYLGVLWKSPWLDAP